jgi:hypothetical protein
MLSELSKEVGVIFFTNTSLCDHDMRTYFAVIDDLWTYAVREGRRTMSGTERM